MRLCYVLLSPTFGMHQYTADLANRMAGIGHSVHLVTTRGSPRDRYAPAVTIHAPVEAANTGFSPQALRPLEIRCAWRAIQGLKPDIVHFTGPHLWNTFLVPLLSTRGTTTLHTLHDLHPHVGAAYGRLLYPWNRWIRSTAGHLLVHGERYRDTLLSQGVAPDRLTCTPLTFLFVSHEQEQALEQSPVTVEYAPRALFFGRLEAYKGLKVLIQASRQLGNGARHSPGIVIAGPGSPEKVDLGGLPAHVELRNRLIGDQEALDLFCQCGVVVLPYIEASQSAQIASAYYFSKPVIVTRVGALSEYVVDGETGWVIPPGDPQALAAALKAALGDLDRLAQMGRAGRVWYEDRRRSEWAALQEMYGRLAGKR